MEQFVTDYKLPDQTSVHLSSLAVPIVISPQPTSEDNVHTSREVKGIVVSSRDVTEQVRLQEEKNRIEKQYHQAQKGLFWRCFGFNFLIHAILCSSYRFNPEFAEAKKK